MTSIKITEEELNQIRTLQSKFQEKVFQLGNLYIEKMGIESAVQAVTAKESSIMEEWKQLQKQENDLVNDILKKYGEGSLDLKEGVFVPDKPPQLLNSSNQ